LTLGEDLDQIKNLESRKKSRNAEKCLDVDSGSRKNRVLDPDLARFLRFRFDAWMRLRKSALV